MSQKPEPSNRRNILLFLAMAALVMVALYLNWRLLHGHDWTARASFGDMFGLANAVFSGLAFAAFIVTLSMQREELGYTRDEMTRTADAQVEASNALKSQLDELVKQRRLSIMPAFTITPSQQPHLHNLGNGTALNVRVHPIQVMVGTNNEPLFLPIRQIIFIVRGGNEKCLVQQVEPEIIDGESTRLLAAQYLLSGDYTVDVSFQDIEGTAYEQSLSIKAGACAPSPVRIAKSA